MTDHPRTEPPGGRQQLDRRDFLGRSTAALAAIAAGPHRDPHRDPHRRPHHRPRARAVILLGMVGAPSQVDLFADKPELRRQDGRPVPPGLLAGERFAFLAKDAAGATWLAPPWPGRRHGASGAWLSDLLPHHRHIVDRLTWLDAVVTDEINHVPAQMLFQTGSPRPGRPAIGAWIDHGIGSANPDLPAYVVLSSGKASRCGAACWGAGFLPGRHQGVPLGLGDQGIAFLDDPDGMPRALRAHQLAAMQRLGAHGFERDGDPATPARLANAELAFRMQRSVPELTDLAMEDRGTLDLYGAEVGVRSYGANCLLARRLVERGVRIVQLLHGGWDHHGGSGDQNLWTDLPRRCAEIDRGTAALVLDLERRGLLDDTLVVFGGEFGRTPMLQGPRDGGVLGRDHQRTAFTMWMAGAGLRPGFRHGVTDEFGVHPIGDAVHVHDVQATILHLLGLDHERLTYRWQGRDFRLTDVHGQRIDAILG